MKATTELVELKPCPFCGSGASFLVTARNERNCTWVACEVCEAEGPARDRDDGETAAELWNTRSPANPEQVEVVASAMMSFLFEAAQPDRGDVFSWLDDRRHELAKVAIAALGVSPR